MKNQNIKISAMFLAGALSSSSLYAQHPPYYAPEKPNIEINLEVLRSLAPAGRTKAVQRYQRTAPLVMQSLRGNSRPSAPARPSAPQGRRVAMDPLPKTAVDSMQRHTPETLPRLKPQREEPDEMTLVVGTPKPEPVIVPPPVPEPPAPEPKPKPQPLTSQTTESAASDDEMARKQAPLFEKPDLGLPREILPPLPPLSEGSPPPLPNLPGMKSEAAEQAEIADLPPAESNIPPLPQLPPLEAEQPSQMPPLPWGDTPPDPATDNLPNVPSAPMPEENTASAPSAEDASFSLPPLPPSAQDWLATEDGNNDSATGNTPPPLPIETKPAVGNFPDLEESPDSVMPPLPTLEAEPEETPLPPSREPMVPPMPPTNEGANIPMPDFGSPNDANGTPPTLEFEPIPMPDFSDMNGDMPAGDTPLPTMGSMGQQTTESLPTPPPLDEAAEPDTAFPPHFSDSTNIASPPVDANASPAQEEDNSDIFSGVKSSFKNLLTAEEPIEDSSSIPPVAPRPPKREETTAPPELPQPQPQPNPVPVTSSQSDSFPEETTSEQPDSASAPAFPVISSPKPIPEPELPSLEDIEQLPVGEDKALAPPAFPELSSKIPSANTPTLPSLGLLQDAPEQSMALATNGSSLPSMASLRERDNPPALEIPGEGSAKPLPPLTPDIFGTSSDYEVVEKDNRPVKTVADEEMDIASVQASLEPSAAPPISGPPTSIAINYGVDDTDIPDEQKANLLRLAAGVKDRPNDRIIVTAYASGSPEEKKAANMISLSRALSLRAFMIDAGINMDRIIVQAKGLENPGGEADRADIRVE